VIRVSAAAGTEAFPRITGPLLQLADDGVLEYCGIAQFADEARASARTAADTMVALRDALRSSGAGRALADGPTDLLIRTLDDEDSAEVDDLFQGVLEATASERRDATEELKRLARASVIKAGVSLAVYCLALLIAAAGSVFAWRHANASVAEQVAYERLLRRHEQLEDVLPLSGLRAEVLSLAVPGWEDLVALDQQQQHDLNEEEGGVGNKTDANWSPDDAYNVFSTAANFQAAFNPVTGAAMTVDLGKSGRSTAETANDIILRVNRLRILERIKEVGRLRIVTYKSSAFDSNANAMTTALSSFAVTLASRIAKLRAYVPQPCFGDIEADSAAAVMLATRGPTASGLLSGVVVGRATGHGNATRSGGGGTDSNTLSGRQAVADIRARELRVDKTQNLCVGTLVLIDGSAVVSAVEAAQLSEATVASLDYDESVKAVRPAFVAVSRFVALLEEVINRHDGLIVGVGGDEIACVWNVVGQSALHQVRAVAAAMQIARRVKEEAITAKTAADEITARIQKQEAVFHTAQTQGNKAKLRKAERSLALLRQQQEEHLASARWFASRSRGVVITTGLMCAGTVTASVSNGSSDRGGGKGTRTGDGLAAGVIDRSHRGLDQTRTSRNFGASANDSGGDSAQKRRASIRSRKGVGSASILPAAAPRWFELTSPTLGLASIMLRLNARLHTTVLATQDVAEAAAHSVSVGVVLDDAAAREVRATTASGTSSSAEPVLYVRPVAVVHQQSMAHMDEHGQTMGSTALSGNRAQSGVSGSSAQHGAKGHSSGRVLSASQATKGTAGTWATVCALHYGAPADSISAPPAGWSAVFDELSRNVRKGNTPAAHKALKEYLADAAATAAATAAGNASPVVLRASRVNNNGVAVGRVASDSDPIIKAWLSDLTAAAAGTVMAAA
jgi:hypothetical protein